MSSTLLKCRSLVGGLHLRNEEILVESTKQSFALISISYVCVWVYFVTLVLNYVIDYRPDGTVHEALLLVDLF